MREPTDTVKPQMASPSFRLPALDQDYLLGDSTRGVRFMLEYSKAEEILRKWRVKSTIVVFGSARTRPDGKGNSGRWYQMAREFGNLASRKGGALKGEVGEDDLRNVIATGGGPGIMEAANRGADEAGAPTIGFNITLPHEQEPNSYSTPDLTFNFHYFAMRKMHLAMRASALVVFPGGFGTMDELFELLTLIQTEKMPEIPIVLVDEAYWTSIVNFRAFADNGTISQDDLSLFEFADDADGIWHSLARRGLTV